MSGRGVGSSINGSPAHCHDGGVLSGGLYHARTERVNEDRLIEWMERRERWNHVLQGKLERAYVEQFTRMTEPPAVPRHGRQLIDFARDHFGQRLSGRLEGLLAARPAYAGHRLRIVSLRFALNFIATMPTSWRLPDDWVLAPTGNLQASWRRGGSRVVAQFQSDERVWFTAIEQRELMVTGRRPVHEFVAAVESFNDVVRR